jgi:UDP-2,3-diacylglucosamine pyrophosphatase LpxH
MPPSTRLPIDDILEKSKRPKTTRVDRHEQRTMIISDMHAPYHHPDTIAFLVAVRDTYRINDTVSVGDEVDQHALSFHEHNPDLPSAGEELAMAREFLDQLEKEFPKIEFAESNHGSLIYRKAVANGIPKGMLKTYNEIYDKKQWKWKPEILRELKHGTIPMIIRHSFCQNTASALKMSGGACVIQGHYHSISEITWLQTVRGRIFGMTVGCLIDDKALSFTYNKTQPKRPVIGCGVVIDGNPVLIPMWLDARGRWTGKIPA